MSAFDALPSEHWPDIAAGLALPWHPHAAAHDLRWYAARHATVGAKLPAVRELADRWGWSRTRVHELLTDAGRWRDHARPWGWRTSADKKRTSGGQEADTCNGETPAIDEKADSRRTAGGQEADSRAILTGSPDHPITDQNTLGGSSPPVAADRHDGVPADALPSSADPPAPVVPAEPEAQPGDGGDPDAAGGGSDEAGGPAVAGGEGKPLTADVMAVWEAWRAFHPTARATPSKGAARMLRGALKAATAEQLASAIRWAHLAPHPRASYLRGVEYEAGESNVGAYLGIENLLVAKNLDTRVAWAAEWEAQGSPDYRDQPREMPTRVEELTAKDRRAVETMRYLIDGVDVADHADPDHARAILRAWNDCPGTAGITATRSTPAQFLDAALIAELRRIRAWVASLPKGVTDAR